MNIGLVEELTANDLMDSEFKLFSGTSNPGLCKLVAQKLKLQLGSVELKQFADGECSVLLNEEVRGKNVFVIQSTSTPVNDNTMELVLLIDALRRASAGRITAIVPYMGYSRQDRLMGRSPISARLVADLVCTSGANAFVSVDLHSNAIEGFFNIPIDNLSAIPLFAKHFQEKLGPKVKEECVVVSPDVGGVKRARNLARLLDCPLAIIDKQRAKAGSATVANVIGEVLGRKAILIDDMVDTASSITPAANALIEKGAALVYAAATHGVLSNPAFERISQSGIKELVITDSIPIRKGAPQKIKVLSLCDLLTQTITDHHSSRLNTGA